MIEVEQLCKFYGSHPAIVNLDFKVETGEILGFLGPNGAGKTTTMRILSGYLPASAGTAKISGFDVHEQPLAVRQRIGYLPETPPLYSDMTVEGFLTFVAELKGVPAGDRPTRVDGAIDRCGLKEKRKTLIRKLSKGFRQRVGIAHAIVHDPPVIILDEPTVGLDPRQIIEVRELIKSLGGQHTIILSTHILPEVSMTCDRVTIINQGKVVKTDSPEALTTEASAGGYTYDLEVEGDATEILTYLRGLSLVKAATLQERSGLSDGHHSYSITTATPEDIGKDLAKAIVSQDFGLYELRRNRASLEDVFLQLTTQERGED
ncbi:MAG: ABC transporter ATP-binding protein [Prochlorotrichaceae cyanobacterium]